MCGWTDGYRRRTKRSGEGSLWDLILNLYLQPYRLSYGTTASKFVTAIGDFDKRTSEQ